MIGSGSSGANVLARLRVEGCLGGLYSPRYACVHPARLARGLAETVERLGVSIYERTPALPSAKRAVDTPGAGSGPTWSVLATEAYTVQLPGASATSCPSTPS